MRPYTQLTLFELAEPQPEYVSLSDKLSASEAIKSISRNDPRFGSFVSAIDPRAKTLGVALGRLRPKKKIARSIVDVLRALEAAVSKAQALPLEAELKDLVSAVGIQRIDPVLRYLGFDGLGCSTLQEAANEVGITRERVRQLADKVSRRFGRDTFAPVLDRTLEALDRLVGVADSIELGWKDRGLTKGTFRAEGIIQAAKVFARDCKVRVTTLGNTRILVDDRSDKAITSARRIALRTCLRFTVMSLRDVEARVEGKFGPTGLDFAAVLEGLSGFEWLSRPSGWFWIKARRSRLLHRVSKIASVTPQIALAELRSGIARDHRMAGFAPPRHVLRELCQRAGYRVQKDTVIADEPLDPGVILGVTERTMARVLKDAGGLLGREAFKRGCLAHGMNANTFEQYLSYSPIVSRFAIGVYGLCGAQIQAGDAERLRSRTIPREVLRDYGYAQHGKMWLGYRLSGATARSGVLTIPSKMCGSINGDFLIRSETGEELGHLHCHSRRAWGLLELIERRGLEAGDFLMLTFDPHKREARATYGTEEPWADIVESMKVELPVVQSQ